MKTQLWTEREQRRANSEPPERTDRRRAALVVRTIRHSPFVIRIFGPLLLLSASIGLCLASLAQLAGAESGGAWPTQDGTFYAVSFYPTNSPQALAGYPRWEPVPGGVRALGTNTSPLLTGEVLFTWAALDNPTNGLYATNRAAMQAYQTAQAAPMQANINRLLALYAQIPVGRVMLSNDMTSLTNIYGSLASGTNTQAQVVAQVNKANAIQNDQMIIQQAILEFLQRLGPVLQQIYDPSRDTTQ